MEEVTSQSTSSKKSPLGWIAFVIVVLVLGAASFAALQNRPESNDSNQSLQEKAADVESVAPNTIVYGTWTGTNTEIVALDLSTLNTSTIARLPVAIKKVNILSPEKALYIGQTDFRDHGKKLVISDIKNQTTIAEVPADNGFGIDDYVISPNKQFVAMWEISFSEGSEKLLGGRSRVYAINLADPSKKQLLYDEVADESSPVNYPRAILDNGRVFTDKFQPNDPNGGTGWAYGMSVINFNGSGKTELSQMQQGSYGTQPALSPDGKYLAFAGYDGTLGDGNAINNGYRQALLTPNTIEILDTNTLVREKLPNFSNDDYYTSVDWDQDTEHIIYNAVSKNISDLGIFSYNISADVKQKIAIPLGTEDNPFVFIAKINEDKSIVAEADPSPSTLGNLGDTYAPSITQLYVYQSSPESFSPIIVNNSLLQFISMHPEKYFSSVLGVAHAQGGNPADPNVTIIDLYSDKPSQENLQLKTFLMKPELAPVRELQQTDPPPETPQDDGPVPKCRDLADRQCKEQGYAEGTNNYWLCYSNQISNNRRAGICYDSPLYVYGAPGQKLNVKIQTPVYNDVPAYSNGYNVTILKNSKMQIDGKAYDSIAYDYHSNLRRIKPPTKGTIVTKKDVEKTLKEYAKKLGLNEKETNDLVGSGVSKITSPYAFISFFDHSTSHAILPLTFNPEPDNYRNIVFYFKLLDKAPNYSVEPPAFEPINRAGLTVVEISEIVE